MTKYIVTRREVWTQGFLIEAESEEEAIRRVLDGEGEIAKDLFAYSHIVDDDAGVTCEENSP